MMRINIVIWILIFIPFVALTQKIERDTITIAKKETKFIPSDFGIGLNVGVTKNFYDNRTADFVGNFIGFDFRLQLFYKNMFLTGSFKPGTVNLKKPLQFGQVMLNGNADLNIIKSELGMGYSINLNKKISIDPSISYLSTKFLVINEEEIGQEVDSKSTKGISLGFTINKYFRLNKYQDYLVLFLNNNYNYSNYNKINEQLGNSYYAMALGIGYKGLFLRKVQ